MIFDTTFIIDLMQGDSGAFQKLEELKQRGEQQQTTAVTIFELFTGIMQSQKPIEEKRRVLQQLRSYPILHLAREAGEKGGEVDGTLINEGQMIRPLDCMIAGIALIKKDRILTRNTKDFSKIKGLMLERY